MIRGKQQMFSTVRKASYLVKECKTQKRKQKEERNISNTFRKVKEAITEMKQEKTIAIKNQKARKISCIQL